MSGRGWFWSRPANPHSLEKLKSLYSTLKKNKQVTNNNKDTGTFILICHTVWVILVWPKNEQVKNYKKLLKHFDPLPKFWYGVTKMILQYLSFFSRKICFYSSSICSIPSQVTMCAFRSSSKTITFHSKNINFITSLTNHWTWKSCFKPWIFYLKSRPWYQQRSYDFIKLLYVIGGIIK